MAKRKKLPPLTPRTRQVVNYVVNTVALGTHDNDAEIGAVAKAIEMTPARLQRMAEKLTERGWLKIKGQFLYPTVEALRWQEPDLSESQARNLLRRLK
jgi:DNA-binding IclR family transcriptional regulator